MCQGIIKWYHAGFGFVGFDPWVAATMCLAQAGHVVAVAISNGNISLVMAVVMSLVMSNGISRMTSYYYYSY